MSKNNTKHINELYATGTTKVSEWKQAKRLRDMIKDGSVLDKAEREILLGILDQWIEILEDEGGGEA